MLAHARVCGRRRNASRHTPSGSSQSDGRSPGLRVVACFRLPGARPVALWKQTRRLQLRGQPRLGLSPHRVPFSPSVFRPRAPSFARLETGPAVLQDATARCPARKSKPLYWQLVLRSGLTANGPDSVMASGTRPLGCRRRWNRLGWKTRDYHPYRMPRTRQYLLLARVGPDVDVGGGRTQRDTARLSQSG